MFGLGVSKLLVLIIVVLAVWYGFKYVNRVEEVRRASLRRKPAGPARRDERVIEAEDMVKCRSCGAYVTAKGATRCGRSDCPWPG
jgi:uncharacterized protein